MAYICTCWFLTLARSFIQWCVQITFLFNPILEFGRGIIHLAFFIKQCWNNLKDLHYYVLIKQTSRLFLCITQVTQSIEHIASEVIHLVLVYRLLGVAKILHRNDNKLQSLNYLIYKQMLHIIVEIFVCKYDFDWGVKFFWVDHMSGLHVGSVIFLRYTSQFLLVDLVCI